MTGKKKLIELSEKECRQVSGGDSQDSGTGFLGGGTRDGGGAMGNGH